MPSVFYLCRKYLKETTNMKKVVKIVFVILFAVVLSSCTSYTCPTYTSVDVPTENI